MTTRQPIERESTPMTECGPVPQHSQKDPAGEVSQSGLRGDKEILIAARKLIERPEDWARSASEDDRYGKRCVTTAICEITKGYARGKEVLATFQGANNIAGSDLGGIWSWNDAPERTHAEVLAAFDRAIEATS